MTTPSAPKTRRHPRSVRYESKREREFYRYYEPIRALTTQGPAVCDLFDEHAVKAHEPFSSPDPALTAFCQLAALRLDTRRAMLFFFDSSNAYVLAEATRTLSLKDDSVFDQDDHLWLGHSVIPRGFTICEETVCKMPPSDGDQSAEDGERNLIHIINDLEQDTQFCDRPYVTDGPKARFYAGVPITTPRGINIGALCCLDDKKRDGVGAKGITFLHDMASTVMKHLEGVRARVEHERGTKMVSGLSAFIEGASNLRDGKGDVQDDSEDEDSSRPKLQRATVAESGSPKQDVKNTLSEKISHTPSGGNDSVESDIVSTLPDIPSPGSAWTRSTIARREAEDLRQQLVASNIRSTFQRAARLVREATETDGAVFLDATVSGYGGLVEGSRKSTGLSEDGTDVTETDGEDKHVNGEQKDRTSKVCGILASSQLPQDHLESQRTGQNLSMPEKLLRSLLRRYGHGKIWNFDDSGEASSDDNPTDDGTSTADDDGPQRVSQSNASERVAGRPRKRRTRASDAERIQRVFPGVRSLAFVGQWDQNRGRWFSACIVYSYSPLRLLSQESEANYITAFCDVLMAEIHRVEADNSSKAKTDFISSISHELRTPLHGILGSVECLNEQKLDDFTADLSSQIETCGRTLLDIVDHLLEFAKINHYAKARAVLNEETALHQRDSASDADRGRLGVAMSLDADVALDEVTEEVVDTAVYSYCCAQDKEHILERRVNVILDIEKIGEMNWLSRIPVGAWKRTVINLISNSLKHTSRGYIHISLRRTLILGKRKKFKVILTVTDTGRGMSKAFVEDHLFKAFSQEDSLVEGTGLGMSLVAKIVTALGGNIEVQSEQGVGTAVTVSIPVEAGQSTSAGANTKPWEGASSAAQRPLTANLVSFQMREDSSSTGLTPVQAARDLTFRSIEQGLLDCGHKSVQTEAAYEPTADIFIILEGDLPAHIEQQHSAGSASTLMTKPAIVLCHSVQSARQLRTSKTLAGSKYFQFVPQPCGPRRLAKAVKDCLNITEDDTTSATAGAERNSSLAEDSLLNIAMRSASQQQLHVRTAASTTDAGSPKPSQEDTTPTPPSRALDHQENVRPPLPPQPSRSSYFPATMTKPNGDVSGSPITMSPITPVVTPGMEQKAADTRRKLKLLLVDDNHVNLQLLVHYARKQGHDRITARDGQEAADAYKAACAYLLPPEDRHAYSKADAASGKPDVICMDINMPVMDGLQSTRLIRAFERQYDLAPAYILALTGLGSAQAQQEAFSSGIDLFLTKPVSLRELTKLLDQVRKSGTISSEV